MTSTSELKAQNEKLLNSLKTAKDYVDKCRREVQQEENELKLFDKLSNRVATLEMERRKERIAAFIQWIYPENEIIERIHDFAKCGLTIEQIDVIVKPFRKKK